MPLTRLSMASSSTTAASVQVQPQSVATSVINSGTNTVPWDIPGSEFRSQGSQPDNSNRFATNVFDCHKQCCPSCCASIWCPCFVFARIKAKYNITAGTGTSAFWPNVLFMGVVHVILWTDVWANMVGFTKHGCTLSEYFQNITFTPSGSLAHCTKTRLGDAQDVLNLAAAIAACLLLRALRHDFRQLHQLPSHECDRCSCDADGEDCVLGCCCGPCMLAQMARQIQVQENGGDAESLRVCVFSPAACANTCAPPPTQAGQNHGIDSMPEGAAEVGAGSGTRSSQVAPLKVQHQVE